MRNYIKTNKKVVKELGLTMRLQLPDGNYALYYDDFLRFGCGYSDYPSLLEETGSIMLSPAQVRAEQQGGTPHALPNPENEKWRMENGESSEDSEVSEDSENSEVSEVSGDSEDSNQPINPSTEK